MKENVRNVSEKQENMRLNNVNSKKITSLWIIISLVKNIFLFFYIYKMYLISAEGYKNAGLDLLRVKKLLKSGQKWKIYKMV